VNKARLSKYPYLILLELVSKLTYLNLRHARSYALLAINEGMPNTLGEVTNFRERNCEPMTYSLKKPWFGFALLVMIVFPMPSIGDNAGVAMEDEAVGGDSPGHLSA